MDDGDGGSDDGHDGRSGLVVMITRTNENKIGLGKRLSEEKIHLRIENSFSCL